MMIYKFGQSINSYQPEVLENNLHVSRIGNRK